MNIFVLDKDPELAARYHCDKHINKMVVESGQLLSFAHHRFGSATEHMYEYSKAHVSHPCTLWLCESTSNYWWLYRFMHLLAAEYTRRYHKEHKTIREVAPHLKRIPRGCRIRPMTPHVQCMPEEFRQANVVEAYRDFYASKLFTYTSYNHSPMPKWLARRMGDYL